MSKSALDRFQGVINSKTPSPDKCEYHEILIYSLKDITSDSFGTVFEARSDDQAARSISHHMSLEPTTLFAMYPQDYQLWRIGTFDRNSGAFISTPTYLNSCASLTVPVKSE